jgi:glycine/D-amino acid oxidase-like deaminating enzyme/nitrite reductase/ring-hydroxylating ferredoxin subunit
MKRPDGMTEPLWCDGIAMPKYRALSNQRSVHADVCVIGAGIAGLTTAYLLASEGHSVVVFDEGQIGDGQTGRTSAHLASAIDDRFIEIERLHGEAAARLAYESHAKAIDTIERISREEKIPCEFARLNAFLSPVACDAPDLLDQELAAAKRAGFADVEKLARGGFDSGPCLRFGHQARFHPILYLAGLAEATKRKGGKIYTGRRVMDVQGTDPKKKTPARVKLQGMRKTITAKHIVVATNTPAPINDWFGIYTKQASYRSYVIAVSIPQRSVEDALYWDTGDPYHYVRIERSHGRSKDLLLIGGEDHKTGQFPEHGAPFMKLEEWGRKRFPMMEDVTFRWSGQVQEPADGLAFIGRAVTDTAEVFVATGDSGMGLTHGTIAGLLITDQIAGRANPWEKLYDPARKMFNLEFMKENANTLAQYTDLITPGEVKSAEEIPAGHGAVMRDGATKLAVYRDEKGKIHQCSAICTHMQCVVRWNHVERTWDCPCHGSRFDPTGKVLMGPAVDNLPHVR